MVGVLSQILCSGQGIVMSDASVRSDAELAAAARTDPAAFGEVDRRHERAVLAYFLRWSRVPEVAADLTRRDATTAPY